MAKKKSDPRRIKIERYPEPMAKAVDSVGLIEGETTDGKRWILWLDYNGLPSVYWPERDYETGAVIGKGIALTRRARKPGRERAATP